MNNPQKPKMDSCLRLPLPVEMHEQLRRTGADMDRSVCWIIRDAISKYIEHTQTYQIYEPLEIRNANPDTE